MEKFENLNAQVMGVSGDKLETLEKFKSEYSISFPLVADPQKKVRKLYGWGRKTYIIDKKGIVRFKDKGVPSNSELLTELAKIQ